MKIDRWLGSALIASKFLHEIWRRSVIYASWSPLRLVSGLCVDGKKVYVDISAGNWKQRLYNQRHSFSNPQLRNQTAQSKYFWSLKDQGLSPQIKWQIIRHPSTANIFNGRCNLCIDEKEGIINFKNRRLLLNERNELVFKCRHRRKFKLSWQSNWNTDSYVIAGITMRIY